MICEDALSSTRSIRWRVTNNSLSGHLRCIEVPAAQPHIRAVHQLLAAAIVTIRIYNYAAVPSERIDAARAAADGIFQDAAISLQWIDCRVPGVVAGTACFGPLAETEFVLRLLESFDPNTSRHLALGSSLLDTDARSGVLITIDPGRTTAVAGQAGMDPSLLLGRAIAHELGHMLMGTSEHARAGLMRALWSQRELRQNHSTDWCFSSREVRDIRRGLAARIRAAN